MPLLILVLAGFVQVILAQSDPGSVLERLTRQTFPYGEEEFRIEGATTDRDGNIFLAGSTTRPDLIQKESQVLISRDLGQTFGEVERKGAVTSLGTPQAIAVNPSNANVILVASTSSNSALLFGRIYKSTDGGVSWRPVFSRSVENCCLSVVRMSAIAFDPTNGRRAFASTSDGLLASSDGGDTWQNTEVKEQGEIRFDPHNSQRVAVGAALSMDGGKTFAVLSYRALSFDTRGRIWGVLDTSVAVSSDNGQTWTQRARPTELAWVGSILADPDLPNVLYVSVGALVYRSNDDDT